MRCSRQHFRVWVYLMAKQETNANSCNSFSLLTPENMQFCKVDLLLRLDPEFGYQWMLIFVPGHDISKANDFFLQPDGYSVHQQRTDAEEHYSGAMVANLHQLQIRTGANLIPQRVPP